MWRIGDAAAAEEAEDEEEEEAVVVGDDGAGRGSGGARSGSGARCTRGRFHGGADVWRGGCSVAHCGSAAVCAAAPPFKFKMTDLATSMIIFQGRPAAEGMQVYCWVTTIRPAPYRAPAECIAS